MELVLNDQAGMHKYLTKVHESIIPREIENIGKSIEVGGSQVYNLDKRSKMRKFNTSVLNHLCQDTNIYVTISSLFE